MIQERIFDHGLNIHFRSRGYFRLDKASFFIDNPISSWLLLRKPLRFIRTKGFDFWNILLIGNNKRLTTFASRILEEETFGLKIIGYLDELNRRGGDGKLPPPIKCLGDLNQLQTILNSNIVDEVFIGLPVKSFCTEIEDIIKVCTERGVGVRIVTDLFILRNTKNSIDMVNGIPILNINPGPDDLFALFIKRCIDIVIAGALLILILPFLLIVALAIKFDSTGPAIFVQERVGCNNRRFNLLKFRTMVSNADALQATLKKYNEMEGPVFKMRNDPRVTRIGKYLRRFSVDELPQLINVLKGEMSLVGPRPPIPGEVKEYSWKQKRRLSVKPGITGLWQVNGRNTIPFNQWVEMDLKYIDNWSLGTDIKILLRTIYAALAGKGAM